MRGESDKIIGGLRSEAEMQQRTRRLAVHNLLKTIEATEEGDLREGLLETPLRVAKAYDTWFGGYDEDPAKILKAFEDGAEMWTKWWCRLTFRFTRTVSTTWPPSSVWRT